MAQQGVFTLPANTNFGVTAFANAANTQTIKVLVDNVVKATFSGSGTSDKLLGSQVLNSGRGAVQIQVSVNGKPSDLVSNQTILANKLNFAMVGSEDSSDNDYNDGIAVLNWPLG
ncbi:fucose-binding lectin II [Ralstonia syzygii subsp. celebesensis]|uniref:Fucose-binding lectin n=4 Tax=Ralstonia solanacearum species complex TaxID=3116862 RepID=A0AAD0S466_RALSL|nr:MULTISPECIES: fucose-binding lectin II [Ralstonia solanacearum species complex]CCA80948.1 putative sugar-binding lectin protein [blood disease bacterium R229]AQW30392.1 fucose-binding lectin [blood disease bacterium A2-HR MARDI]AXV80201.1 fucose-binding lectin [Ralstonia solanacearum]AXW51344.1 fucose-binding lectin [Ralstonia solanacearum]QQV55777.1 fucose-binding lectin II [Ralstonia syzygii subsp. celebesensis]